MNVLAFAVLPFLAAVRCHFLADYFADPVGCAADVPVARDYRRAFRERNRPRFPTYGRVLKIFENGFPEIPGGDETATSIECGGGGDGDETWARQSLDCVRKLKAEMDLVVDGVLSLTAAEFGRAMDEYVDRSLELLDAYGKYVSDTPPEGKTPERLPVPFDYLMFQRSHENARCGLRFLLDGGRAEIDAIYRKYAFFAEDRDGQKVSKDLRELRSLVSALSGAGRSAPARSRTVVPGPDGSRKDEPAAEPTTPGDGDGQRRTVFTVMDPLKKKLLDLEDDLIEFSRPFCEETAGRSISAMRWSFLKSWPYYDNGFFVNKSLAKHVAMLGGKQISLKTVLGNLEFHEPLDEIMAAKELVPFILHNYIANIVVDFIALVAIANIRLINFVTVEKPKISAEKTQKFSASIIEIENTYYRYFGRLITVFKLSYEYYCHVMKHDSATIVRLIDFISDLFSPEENVPEKLISNINGLKKMLLSNFHWTQTKVDKIDQDGLKITIKNLTYLVEKINSRLLSLTELINDFKVDIYID